MLGLIWLICNLFRLIYTKSSHTSSWLEIHQAGDGVRGQEGVTGLEPVIHYTKLFYLKYIKSIYFCIIYSMLFYLWCLFIPELRFWGYSLIRGFKLHQACLCFRRDVCVNVILSIVGTPVILATALPFR